MIKFDTEKNEFGELSNFWPHRVHLQYKGKVYPTSEHLFQSLKYLYEGATQATLDYAEVIRIQNTPFKAKLLAKKISFAHYAWQQKLTLIVQQHPLAVRDPDWDKKQVQVMNEVLALKFAQDMHCREVLLSTADNELMEHSKHDSFWADGGDGLGKNHLGRCLVQLREQLLHQSKVSHPSLQEEVPPKRQKIEMTHV